MSRKLDLNKLIRECKINFSRSSGKGGQNVNKVETKAELTFNIDASLILPEEIKLLLKKKLRHKITSAGNVRIYSQSSRTQLGNRKKVTEKFIKMIQQSLLEVKHRIKTDRSTSSKERILKEKKIISQKKKFRMQRDFSDY